MFFRMWARARRAVFLAVLIPFAAAWASPASAQAPSPTLERIKARGTIVIAYRPDAEPFSYRGRDGLPIGYTIDLCKEAADEIRRELRMPDLPLAWLAIDTKTRFIVTEQGLADMVCGATSITVERMAQVEFSMITFVTGARLMVTAVTPGNSIKTVGAVTIGVLANTTSENALRRAIAQDQLPIKVRRVFKRDEALLLLDRGEIAGFVSDNILLAGLMDAPQHRGKFRLIGDLLGYDPYGIVLPRNDSRFKYLVNRRLIDLFRTGRINVIYDRWFRHLKNAVSSIQAYVIAIQALPER